MFLVIAGILLAVVVCAPMIALPLLFAAVAVVVAHRAAAAADVQPLALAALVPFRAPPV